MPTHPQPTPMNALTRIANAALKTTTAIALLTAAIALYKWGAALLAWGDSWAMADALTWTVVTVIAFIPVFGIEYLQTNRGD